MKLKKITAFALAATMAMGGSLTALADGATNSVNSEGTGTYEGDSVPLPTPSITLPTITDGTYNYLTDPNGLISATNNAHYSGATFDSGKLWFLSNTNTYTKDSAKVKVTSENAKDVDVTVKLEVANADDVTTGVGFSTDKTFADDTKTNLYIAIVDTDTVEETKKADVPLTGIDKAVTMTKTIKGVPGNFTLGYSSNTYSYTKKGSDSQGFTAWNSFEYNLTGAINTAGKWDGITTMPTLKVTWSWAEHQDGPSITTTTATAVNGQNTEIAFVGVIADVSDIKFNTTSVKAKTTITDGKITVLSSWTDAWSAGTERALTVAFANGTTGTFTITKQ